MDTDDDTEVQLIFAVANTLSPWGQFFSENGAYLLFAILFLALAAIVSGYETAFFALPKEDLEKFAEKPRPSFYEKWVLHFHANPQQFIATLVIANNAFNVGLIVITTFILADLKKIILLNDWVWTTIDVFIITSIILFVGEITPKIYGAYRQVLVLTLFTFFIRGLYGFFYPMSWLLARSTVLLYRKRGVQEQNITVEELKHAIDITSEEHSPKEEKKILKALVNLNAIHVRTIMRARVDVKAVAQELTTERVLRLVSQYGYSRLPVYQDSLDQIKGVLHIKDMLPALEGPAFDWHVYIRPAYYVPETKKIGKLFNEFKEKKLHIAIVVDEFGGTAGIVTLEDILEEIFGEIGDDSDKDEIVYSKLSENAYIFEGKTPLIDVCKILQLDENFFEAADGENDRLGGLLLELCGTIPAKGAEAVYKNLRFVIEYVTSTHIKRVKIIVLPENEETE